MLVDKENQQITKDELIYKLAALHREISRNGDEATALKVLDLFKKVDEGQYMIGFCGHFSAGKSSMINHLMEADLLPSSPIPTSANIVMIKSGDERCRVFYKHGDIIEYDPPYNYEMIKSFCKDGDAVQSIELYYPSKNLPKGVSIIDTPGIDSMDDAHRVATESALHLADIVFYVMDYNHVQSELNFQFAKQLQDRKKTLFIIVNQIDKHQQNELTFSDFQNRVEQSFNDWGVYPKQVFYTSLRKLAASNNELQALKQIFAEKMASSNLLLNESVMNATQQLIKEYLSFISAAQADEKTKLESFLATIGKEDRKKLDQTLLELEKEHNRLQKEQLEIKQNFISEIDYIINNAYLMSFSTRELAKDYIEASQPEFKVGLFYSSSKTEREREARMHKLFEEVKESASIQLEVHLKEFLITFMKKRKLNDFLSAVLTFSNIIEKSILKETLNKSARLSGEYVITYSNNLESVIKHKYKQHCLQIFEQHEKLLLKQNQQKLVETKASLERCQLYQKSFQRMKQLSLELKYTEHHLKRILYDTNEQFEHDYVENLKNSIASIKITKGYEKASFSEPAERMEQIENVTNVSFNNMETKRTKVITNLLDASKIIRPIPGMEKIADEMVEKAYRLTNKQYTVALFGAFSAGKSSFANALIGEQVLPVSPNPTTSAINKITAPTNEHKHGSIVVKLKSNEQLFEDLQYSLAFFQGKITTIDEGIRAIENVFHQKRNITAKQKPHYSFLAAVKKGYQNIASNLGKELFINLDDFEDYVANEDKACFVEGITLYYHCPLTEKGITLVDTPGADSINARHTEVAFNFIKNADAILFVSYFNHAFSKTDREFLIQLGRIKDVFTIDKMFFIINAADLAQSNEELEEVKYFVSSQLIRYGIRQPRLYAISSQWALMGKRKLAIDTENSDIVLQMSGIENFEADFYTFVLAELTSITLLAAIGDIKRATKIIESYADSARTTNERKLEKQTEMVCSEKDIVAIITNYNIEVDQQVLLQEINELFFYIKQRIFLRFPDLFKEAFNPAVLRDDGRDLKYALKVCLEELLISIGDDLAQEMRATSLRIERFIVAMLEEIRLTLTNKIQLIVPALQLSAIGEQHFTTPEFINGLTGESQEKYQHILALFKSPKSFFEKDGKKKMSEMLQQNLQIPVEEYLNSNKQLLCSEYVNLFQTLVEELQEKYMLEINTYFQAIKQILSDEIDLELLDYAHKHLQEMVM